MDLQTALDWAGQHKNGVLITLRRDGRPQSSDIVYAIDGEHLLISVTDSRAKTHNMRRDNRVVLHLTDPSSWSYLSFDGTVELSPVASDPNDDTCDRLVALYERIAGQPHDDWDEYRNAMVDEARLVVRFTPTSVVGQTH